MAPWVGDVDQEHAGVGGIYCLACSRTVLNIFRDNCQAHLKDLVDLSRLSQIRIVVLGAESAAFVSSSSRDARKLEVEGDEATVGNILKDFDNLRREVTAVEIHVGWRFPGWSPSRPQRLDEKA
jgi:hypothetical protein